MLFCLGIAFFWGLFFYWKMFKRVRKVYILRGVPGSGKSTYAKRLTRWGGVICSADNYMVDEKGNYCFDPKKLPQVHSLCYSAFYYHLHYTNVSKIVLDNTNIKEWEFERYLDAIRIYNAVYDDVYVEVITVGCLEDVEKYIARGIHKVPAQRVKEMAKNLYGE
jgi:2-phosphoglycerate kinase